MRSGFFSTNEVDAPDRPDQPSRAARSGVTASPPSVARVFGPGERDALLAELLRRHHATVWRMLRQLGVAPHKVDDAAQDVFIVIARKLEQIEPGKERRYILNSAIRIAANYRRRGWERHEVSAEEFVVEQRDPSPEADQLLDRKRFREALDVVLDGWPVEIRVAFVLFELDGLSVQEIADLTETKLGTVASRLRRGRELFLGAVKRWRARGVLDGVEP